MNSLTKFHNIVESPHKLVRQWKATTGQKVLGYLCTNLPEELLYASGVLPVRLLGTNEPESVTDSYIWATTFCPFSRDCFAQALKGRYAYIDGITYGFCCLHARHVFESWKKHIPVEFSYELNVPYLFSPHAKTFLVSEMEDFKLSLEKWTGNKITNDNIDKAIEIYNTNRQLMGNLYNLMKADNPPITGAEIVEIALAGMIIDKKEHNILLREALKELSVKKPSVNIKPRLMLLGSVNNNVNLIRYIESLGAMVVTDDYCTGRRYYQTEVVPQENRLAALASREMDRPPCPLKDIPERRRPGVYSKLVDDYRVNGVIYTIQRMCDAHGLDFPAIEDGLKEKGLPVLKLEMDFSIPVGQYRTRIEAFLEMINTTIRI
jgi:benzoyl-CoA reductase subunit C